MQNPEIESSESSLPAGLSYGYRFWFLNAINYQIASGTPVILYVKGLGASSTVLGILASLLPLFAFLQIPAANYLPKIGYKKLMLAGWGMRSLTVFVMACVPLLSFFLASTKVAAILVLLVIFSILRGISVGAWMPWITELLPAGKRGQYLSIEQVAVNLGSLAALGISAMTLQFLPDPMRYSAIFLLSATAGMTSLYALKKIPDVHATEGAKSSSQPVPWGAIFGYAPFRKLLAFNALWAVAVSGLSIFSVSFTREQLHFHDSNIVYLSLAIFVGALVSLPFTARILQKIGLKGTLRLTTFLTACVTFGWLTLAAGFSPANIWMVGLLNFGFGVAASNFSVANSSLAMGVMPVMGRNHFFALFTVVGSLVTALSPILFGILLDSLRHVSRQIGAWNVNHFSLFFAFITVVLLGASLTVSILRESESGPLSKRDFTILGRLRRMGRMMQK